MQTGDQNNNWLNIRYDPANNWMGQIGASADGFVQFETPLHSLRASDRTLKNYKTRHGINTLQGVVSRWAPPSDKNPTENYINFVSQKTGYAADSPIDLDDPTVRENLIAAMMQFETPDVFSRYSSDMLQQARGLNADDDSKPVTSDPDTAIALLKTSRKPPAPAPAPAPAAPSFGDLSNKDPLREVTQEAFGELSQKDQAFAPPQNWAAQEEDPIAIFRQSVRSGAYSQTANLNYFQSMAASAFGDKESMDNHLYDASVKEKEAAVYLSNVESLEEFFEEPTLGGFINQGFGATGAFVPSAAASVTTALIGAGIASLATVSAPVTLTTLAAGTITTATAKIFVNAYAKKIIGDAARKKLANAAAKKAGKKKLPHRISPDEDELLEATYKKLQKEHFKRKRRNMIRGGFAGAATQEFPQGSGTAFGIFAEQGMTDPIHAFQSAGIGGVFTLIGVGSEGLILRNMTNIARKTRGPLARSFLRDTFVRGGFRSSAVEGFTELAQEELSVQQRFAIDSSYTQAQATLDRMSAWFMGAAGGFGIGAAGGAGGSIIGSTKDTASGVVNRAREMVKEAYEGEINSGIDKEQAGAEIEVGQVAVEPISWLIAQLDATSDQKTGKNSVWIDQNTLDSISAEDGKVLDAKLESGEFIGVKTDAGLLLTTDQQIAEAFKANYENDPGDTTKLDSMLVDILGYAHNRKVGDDIAVEVKDKAGNVVWYQSTNQNDLDAVYTQANKLFPADSDYEVSHTGVKEHLNQRAEKALEQGQLKDLNKVEQPELDLDQRTDPSDTADGAQATDPQDLATLEVGDEIDVYNAKGERYKAKVVAVSAKGSVRVINQAGKNVLLGGLSATTLNASNPNLLITQVGPKFAKFRGKKIKDLTDAELVAFIKELENFLEDPEVNPIEGAAVDARIHLNAAKIEQTRRKNEVKPKKRSMDLDDLETSRELEKMQKRVDALLAKAKRLADQNVKKGLPAGGINNLSSKEQQTLKQDYLSLQETVAKRGAAVEDMSSVPQGQLQDQLSLLQEDDGEVEVDDDDVDFAGLDDRTASFAAGAMGATTYSPEIVMEGAGSKETPITSGSVEGTVTSKNSPNFGKDKSLLGEGWKGNDPSTTTSQTEAYQLAKDLAKNWLLGSQTLLLANINADLYSSALLNAFSKRSENAGQAFYFDIIEIGEDANGTPLYGMHKYTLPGELDMKVEAASWVKQAKNKARNYVENKWTIKLPPTTNKDGTIKDSAPPQKVDMPKLTNLGRVYNNRTKQGGNLTQGNLETAFQGFSQAMSELLSQGYEVFWEGKPLSELTIAEQGQAIVYTSDKGQITYSMKVLSEERGEFNEDVTTLEKDLKAVEALIERLELQDKANQKAGELRTPDMQEAMDNAEKYRREIGIELRDEQQGVASERNIERSKLGTVALNPGFDPFTDIEALEGESGVAGGKTGKQATIPVDQNRPQERTREKIAQQESKIKRIIDQDFNGLGTRHRNIDILIAAREVTLRDRNYETSSTTPIGSKVISGGQTGADIIFSQAAKEAGLETGGLMPKGFVTEDGRKPEYAQEFNMEEDPDTGTGRDFFLSRTKKNVANSDGTIIVVNDPENLTPGSRQTVNFARQLNKPFLVVGPDATVESIQQFITENNIKTLNGAGSRGSKLRNQAKLKATLVEAFKVFKQEQTTGPTQPTQPTQYESTKIEAQNEIDQLKREQARLEKEMGISGNVFYLNQLKTIGNKDPVLAQSTPGLDSRTKDIALGSTDVADVRAEIEFKSRNPNPYVYDADRKTTVQKYSEAIKQAFGDVSAVNAMLKIFKEDYKIDRNVYIYTADEIVGMSEFANAEIVNQINNEQQVVRGEKADEETGVTKRLGGRILSYNFGPGGTDIIILDIPKGATTEQLGKAHVALAHELGHSFQEQEFTNSLSPKNRQYDILLSNFLKFQREQGIEYSGSLDPKTQARAMEEWAADQVAANLFDRTKQAKNGGEAIFKRMANRLRAFFQSMEKVLKSDKFRKRFNVSPAFNEYITALVEERSKRVRIAPRRVPLSKFGQATIRNMVVEEVLDVAKKEAGSKGALAKLGRAAARASKSDATTAKWIKKVLGVGKEIALPTDNMLRQLGKDDPTTDAGVVLAQFFYGRSQSEELPGWVRTKQQKIYQYTNEVANILGFEGLSKVTPEAMEILFEAEDNNIDTADLKSEKAKEVRKFLETFYEKENVKKNGKMGKLSNYFPRSINLSEIENSPVLREKLAGLLVKFNKGKTFQDPGDSKPFSITPKIANQIVDLLLSDPENANVDLYSEAGKYSLGLSKARSDTFKSIPTLELRNAKNEKGHSLIVDPALALRNYLSSTIKRTELNKRGGAKEITRLINTLSPKEQEIAENMVQAIMGKVNPEMSNAFRVANSWGLTANIYSLLALTVFASFPDMAGPILRSKEFGGLKNVGKSLAAAFRNDAEAKRFAYATGSISTDALSMLNVNAGEMDYMTEGSKKANDFFFKYTVTEYFTRFTRIFAAGMAKEFILVHGKRAGEQNVYGERSRRYLRELGLTPEDVEAWSNSGQSLDGEVGDKVKMAVFRFVDESIVRPNSAERPAWASDPRFALVWQLKAFFYAYGKTVVGGLARESQNRAKSEGLPTASVPLILAAVTILPLTMLGFDLRERFKGGLAWAIPGVDSTQKNFRRSLDMDWGEYSVEILDRSGVLGAFALLLPLFQGRRYGDPFWISPLGPTFEKAWDLPQGKVKIDVFIPLVNQVGGFDREN